LPRLIFVTVFRDGWDQPQPERDRASDSGTHHKVVRRTSRRIGHGAFACPACDLPLVPMAAVAIGATIECPFCSEARPARQFLRLDEIDTGRNNVYVRTRLP
jgi:hypothetical protein